MKVFELCRKQKEELGYTAEYIAESSGIPLSTVTSYLAGARKSPSVYTVGPICQVLGVSLDEYFGIHPGKTIEDPEVEQRITEAQKETIRVLIRGVKIWRYITLALGVVIAALLIWCVWYDMQALDMGFFRR